MKLIKFFGEMPLSAKIGVFIILVNAVASIGAPVLAPYSESQVVGDAWEPASGKMLLGTDQIGRDLLSRLLYGARNTITLAIFITSIAFSGGIIAGFLAAVLGGWVNQVLSRINDTIMALPTLIFALVALSILGTSTPVLVVVIAILSSTRIFRLSRALANDLVVMDYVEVARLRGEGIWWVMKSEILPNALPPLVAEFGLRFCFVFLFISALSFLGLGIQPPLADWGAMVRENAGAISFGIFIPLVPAAAIAVLTVGINMVVDYFLHKSAGRLHEEL